MIEVLIIESSERHPRPVASQRIHAAIDEWMQCVRAIPNRPLARRRHLYASETAEVQPAHGVPAKTWQIVRSGGTKESGHMGGPAEREAGLGVGAVAQRLGVAPSTLRTWDRRYGIGPSGRSPGGHRRYTSADLARLEIMQRRILAGAPPREAARVALGAPPGAPPPARAHGAGGNRVPVTAPGRDGQRPAAVRGLARAAMALDRPAMTDTVRTALRRDGVVRAWESLIVPVLAGIGRKHAATGDCVEVEHLLSTVLLGCLAETAPPDRPVNVRPVLLACAPEEQHSLPVHALAAALAEAGVDALILGARVPPPALAAAIRRTGSNAVFVWSQTAETGDPAWLAELPASRPPYRLLVGGPGWALDRLPAHATSVTALPEAVTRLTSPRGVF